MRIEQYVMAYGAEQDRIRVLLPPGFQSLRPVLRINAEIRDGTAGYAELNTPVEKEGSRGWLNIGFWENVPFKKQGKTVTFRTEFLEICFTGVGITGGCPAETDNAGCYFGTALRAPECIQAPKEFCDCRFAWKFTAQDAHGRSVGKTIPACREEPKTVYPREAFTVANAAKIPCEQVLGAYMVVFDRAEQTA